MPRRKKSEMIVGNYHNMKVFFPYLERCRARGKTPTLKGAKLYLALVQRAQRMRARKLEVARKRANWTQEQWNDYLGKKNMARMMSSPGSIELKAEPELPPRPPAPPKKRVEKNPIAVELANYGWQGLAGYRRRERMRERNRNNKCAKGHPPWNKDLRMENDARLKHVSDLIHWREQLPT